jgi:hypothetical protein
VRRAYTGAIARFGRKRTRAVDGEDDPAGRASPRRGTAGVYGLLGFLAVVVDVVTAIVAIIIVLGILLVVLKANMGNALVKDVHDAAKFLVGPFDGIFKLKDAKLAIAVNWGIALVVYVIAGRLLASLLRRPGAGT